MSIFLGFNEIFIDSNISSQMRALLSIHYSLYVRYFFTEFCLPRIQLSIFIYQLCGLVSTLFTLSSDFVRRSNVENFDGGNGNETWIFIRRQNSSGEELNFLLTFRTIRVERI